MSAFLLSILVFYILGITGFALIPKKWLDFDKWFALLISPVIGLSIWISIIFLYSRTNHSLKNFPTIAIIFFLTIATIGVFRKRSFEYPLISVAKLLVAPFALLFSSWPILRYGFSWLSYVNDDMNNYVLAAIRFYNHGFFTLPNTDFLSGKDYSQEFYYFHVLTHVRPGSELFLAAYSNFQSGNVLAIFMPSVITLQLVSIFALLAFSKTFKRKSKSITRITFFLAIVMPLSSLGFLYQLIGQVGGLAILIGMAAAIQVTLKSAVTGRNRTGYGLIGLLLTAQLIWYPELLPFLGLIVFLVLVVGKNLRNIKVLFGAGIILIFAYVTLNQYFLQSLKFGLAQIQSTQSNSLGINKGSQLFPYFLKPHGLSSLIGLTPLNQWSREPLESLAIVFSVFVILLLFYQSLQVRTNGHFELLIWPILFVVFAYLVMTKNGFGSFKLAMYSAPFLIISIANFLHSMNLKSKKLKSVIWVFILIFVLFEARTTQFYTDASTGNAFKGFSEIQAGSNQSFQDLIKSALKSYEPHNGTISSNSLNLSQIKQEAIAARGSALVFPTTDIFANFKDSTQLPESVIQRKRVEFISGSIKNEFQQPSARPSTQWLVSTNPYEPINSSLSSSGNHSGWSYSLIQNPKNLLTFIDSSMGHSYYAWGSPRSTAVIFPIERNPMVPGTYMRSIGNDLLFEVTETSPHPMIVLGMTSTVMPQYNRTLPALSVLGANEITVPAVGRGSARLIIPFVNPITINGHKYFQIHMKRDLKPFPKPKSYLSGLYGEQIELDMRRISTFVTDLSLIDSSILLDSKTLSLITKFPADLKQSSLEYSGIYEDGWVAKDSYYRLADAKKKNFIVAGSIPSFRANPKFSCQLSVTIDGQKILAVKLYPGSFSKSIPINTGVLKLGVHRVELHFTQEQILPSPDGRPASALIAELGFK